MAFQKYNILTSRTEIEDLDKYLTQGNFTRIAVDTETNGLFFWKNLVVGISLSVDSKSGFYIPFLIWVPDKTSKKVKKIKKQEVEVFENGCLKCIWTGKEYPEFVTNKEYLYPDFIVKMLKKHLLDSEAELLMHNAPFDVLMIESSLGINLESKVFCDTQLLKHVIDENSKNGLKEVAIQWSRELGIDYETLANKEQVEMGESVVKNGGAFKKTEKHIWRADLEVMGKYAVADTFLTYGVFEVGIEKLLDEYEPRHLEWFFEEEVMPLCREVMIPMKRKGVRIDVNHFKEMEEETKEKMEALEDEIIDKIQGFISDFSIGSSLDDIATPKAIVEALIKEEGLEYPTLTKKGEVKKSLSKPAVEKVHEKDPHWLWAYLLGEDELRYSEDKLYKLKRRIYAEKTGNRHHFNISSDRHLRWLFCKKLGYDPKTLPQTDAATPINSIPSMKANVLKDFFLKNHDFVKPLLLYKKLQKLHSTYIIPALELNNAGFLHMDFLQSGTTSGRFACRGGFNLQTLPRAENLERCSKCSSKNISVINPIKLIALMTCKECGHKSDEILCPSAIKKGFIAPEGYKIVNADYSSLEPRCFAFMSGDQKIKDVYLKNLDFYSKLYCDMEDKEGKFSPDPKAPNFLKKLAPEKRDMIKPVALGIPYGARGPQTAKLMGFKRTGIDSKTGKEKEFLDVDRGSAFRDKYLKTYPDLKNYMDNQDLKACTFGFVETVVGRRRHFKFTKPVFKLLQKEGMDIEEFLDLPRKELETQQFSKHLSFSSLQKLSLECGFHMKDEKGIDRNWAFIRAMFKNELNNSKNYPIQGIAAHIANKAMLETTREFKKKKLDAFVILQVHDEITSYVKTECVEDAVKIQKDRMENNVYAKLIDIPMIAEPIVATNLKQAK